jgi:hypothetical protein
VYYKTLTNLQNYVMVKFVIPLTWTFFKIQVRIKSHSTIAKDCQTL